MPASQHSNRVWQDSHLDMQACTGASPLLLRFTAISACTTLSSPAQLRTIKPPSHSLLAVVNTLSVGSCSGAATSVTKCSVSASCCHVSLTVLYSCELTAALLVQTASTADAACRAAAVVRAHSATALSLCHSPLLGSSAYNSCQ
jgi:hypothetical protein